MTKRERAIEAAAKARFLEGCTDLSRPHVAYQWDDAAGCRREWIKDQIFAMSAAVTEYERVMAEPDDQAEGAV